MEKLRNNADAEKPGVRFELVPVVHRMVKWDFVYRATRRRLRAQMARDHERFRRRIADLGVTLAPILMEQHRTRIREWITGMKAGELRMRAIERCTAREVIGGSK
ncbi:hypothetical protein QAD02_021633 [Eretmocerus hayati]|uniref:Uncharacterized protein n=1 Tax=Eretmocerus hayati TaxID=131215 RepID=A0ACC2PQG6_9HYME|nr:hypothetical protein QAD02_021633 [Eretmocerus hayati]